MKAARGVTAFALFVGSLVLFATPIILLGLVKLLLPKGDLRTRIILAIAWLGNRWVGANDRIIDLLIPTRWDVAGVSELRPDGRYLIISNHQTAVDIFVLFRVFHGKAPFLRFFLKKTLLLFPLLGFATWAAEFPFMNRYSAEYLERHPEKRGLDVITTRRACRRYLRIPVAMLVFIEGTRFTRERHEEQQSPLRNLLRPRLGALGHVLAVMGDQLNDVLDVTIAYDTDDPRLWDFLSGRMGTIKVAVRELKVPRRFSDESVATPGEAREAFRQWVNGLWADKDQLLDQLKGRERSISRAS